MGVKGKIISKIDSAIKKKQKNKLNLNCVEIDTVQPPMALVASGPEEK